MLLSLCRRGFTRKIVAKHQFQTHESLGSRRYWKKLSCLAQAGGKAVMFNGCRNPVNQMRS